MTDVTVAAAAGAVVGWLAAEGVKTPAVRLLDVVAIGPLMIYAARRPETLARWARLTLAAVGGATVTYNGRNYIRQGHYREIELTSWRLI